MPVFEYKCTDCNNKFEVLHKSAAKQEEVSCPNCNSSNSKKLFSSFSASIPSGADYSSGSCAGGNCSVPDNSYSGGCSSGMCGLN